MNQLEELIEQYKNNPQSAIEQVELCNYECEAGPLKNNVAWDAIRKILSAYRKPTAEEVESIDRAIEWYQTMRMAPLREIEELNQCEDFNGRTAMKERYQEMVDKLDLAITALRRMKGSESNA